ncbi:MAG: hypothetical protein GY862_05695 [Gammaproteobacteria bacterium]|nr:hypothetical protein [Gammaproteobacteria bacterium]
MSGKRLALLRYVRNTGAATLESLSQPGKVRCTRANAPAWLPGFGWNHFDSNTPFKIQHSIFKIRYF